MSIWTIAGIGCALLSVLLIWLSLRMWSRTHKGFHSAVREMEREIGTIDRYQIPWILLVGDNDENAFRLCRTWQLKKAATKGWYGQWWCSSEGGILQIPSDIFLAPDTRRSPLSTWQLILGTILKTRPRRPLDAIIWHVSIENLMSDEDMLRQAVIMQKRFADLQQRLGLSLPVYLILTECENIVGIQELILSLPAGARDTPLGWSSPYALEKTYRSGWLIQALASVEATLRHVVLELSALQGKLEEPLYRLPRQFTSLLPLLQSLCDPVFRGNALDEAPLLRGIYFTSDTTFSAQLLRRRIFAERGLAQPIKRILHLRRRGYRLALVLGGVVMTVWLGAILICWDNQRAQADAFTAQIRLLQGGISIHDEMDGQEKKFLNLFWRIVQDVPAWRFETLVYPGSLTSRIDTRISQQFHAILAATLIRPMQKTFEKHTTELMSSPRLNALPVGGSPENWPSYDAAKKLASNVAWLEEVGRHYDRLLSKGNGSLEEAADLSRELYGVSIAVADLPTHAILDAMLADFDYRWDIAEDFEKIKSHTTTQFSTLLRTWFDQLYPKALLEQNVKDLEQRLLEFSKERYSSVSVLNALSQNIARLQILLGTTNVALSRSGTQEPVPGYNAMLEKARHSVLISTTSVDAVERYGQDARNALTGEWLTSGNGVAALIMVRPDGTLEANADLLALNRAIQNLLSQPFFMEAIKRPSPVGNAITLADGLRIKETLELFKSYQVFVRHEENSVPSQYRYRLENIARDGILVSMWGRLTDSEEADSSPREKTQTSFETSTDELIQAFASLGRDDLALRVRLEAVAHALRALQQDEETLRQQNLYLPRKGGFSWWDGRRGAASTAFGTPSDAALQQYLSTQIRLVTMYTPLAEKRVAWLGKQKEWLAPNDTELLSLWQANLLEMQKYVMQNPTSTPARLETLVMHTLNEMERDSCQSLLEQAEIPAGIDFFSKRALFLHTQAKKQCDALQAQSGNTLYGQLSDYFNQNLAGRFPFSADSVAPDADPRQVVGFLRLLKEASALQTPESPAKQDFLDQMRNIQPLLSALFGDDGKGVEVGIIWRTHRQQEIGADQIIDWRLSVQSQNSSYPISGKNSLRWRPGLPVTFSLRWASGSLLRPQADPTQSTLHVTEPVAEWRYRGQWALLRFLSEYGRPVSPIKEEQSSSMTELMLKVPVRDLSGNPDQNHAQVFLQIGMSAIGSKDILPLTALPTRAP